VPFSLQLGALAGQTDGHTGKIYNVAY